MTCNSTMRFGRLLSRYGASKVHASCRGGCTKRMGWQQWHRSHWSRAIPVVSSAISGFVNDSALVNDSAPKTPVTPASKSSKASKLDVEALDMVSNAGGSIGRLAGLNHKAQQAAAQGPVSLYNYFVSTGTLRMNCDQGMIVYKLSNLFESMSRGDCCSTQRGFYIHGSVGCGKTMAMDIFAASVKIGLPHLNMTRVHLNRFLEMVHNDVTRLRKEGLDLEYDAANAAGCRFQRTMSGNQASVAKPFNLGRQDDRGMRRTGSAAGWVYMERSGSESTAIERLARRFAKKFDVLCLDEVSITNLQNCVILGPLIRALCDEGVILIATSNKSPHDLYEEGLDRHLHLPPLAAAISDNCIVIHQDSDVDYRKLLSVAEGDSRVFEWRCGNKADSRSFLDSWWEALAGTDCRDTVGVGYGRTLPVLQSQCRGCVRFDFKDLCTYPPVALGSADYAELCDRFHTVVVSDVPRLRPESQDAARRWTLFLDSCYENHVRLILSTEAKDPEDMINLGSNLDTVGSHGQSLQEASFAISRCVSRMYEMQSKLYQDACSKRIEERIQTCH